MPLSINVSHLPFCIYNVKELSNILKVFQRGRLNSVAEIEIHSRANKCGQNHDWHLPRWDYAYVFQHQIAIAPVPYGDAQVCRPKHLWQHFKKVVAMDGNFIWIISLKTDSDTLGPSYRKPLGTLYCAGASRSRARIHPTSNKLALLRKIVQCQDQQRCLSSINKYSKLLRD
jgi:hypothetical protein